MVTWDANGAAEGQTDGSGTWLADNMWWTGSINTTWNSGIPHSAVIGNGGTGGSITLGNVTAGSVAFTNFSGAYTLSGGNLTASDGITIATNAGNVTLNSAIDGAGGIAVNGKILTVRQASLSYSGDTIINHGGLVHWFNNYSPNSCIIVNEGYIRGYYNASFNRTLGTGGNQTQILGGESGFAGNKSFNISLGSSAVVWGSDFFKPEILVLGERSSSYYMSMSFNTPIDLNGATRTVKVDTLPRNGRCNSIIARAISDGADGVAGLIKTGVGRLRLTAANTYTGLTTVAEGCLLFGSAASIGGSGRTVVVSNGATVAATYGIDNAFLNRLAETTNAFTVALAANSTNDLDFSSSTGANLPNASLGTDSVAGEGNTQPSVAYGYTYSGTLTPHGRTYRLGGHPYAGTLTVASELSGTRDVIVSANVTLTGALSYKGDTTVTSGSLTLNTMNQRDDTQALRISSGATVDLNFTGTNAIAALVIDDTPQPEGLYTEASLAELTGTGSLNVIGYPPVGAILIVK
jgi:autotransporter-associated beta strand protein